MSHTRLSYDSYRDAMKYRQMLLAIEQATTQIRQFEQESRPDIDQVMARLLPQLAGALDAELAFVATPTDAEATHFHITASFPSNIPKGDAIDAPLLRAVVRDGRARVIDPLGKAAVEPIEGLQSLGARTGVLVRMQIEPGGSEIFHRHRLAEAISRSEMADHVRTERIVAHQYVTQSYHPDPTASCHHRALTIAISLPSTSSV